ncbi:hypothetical protein [Chthonobacter albigriseus]|uniref:hypothetical protein n=1 Tax=Chthonobacter albigriseus TaxID=1683161 RepID=UPI0015EF410D|nr:hypothetical protein [Chthonobacter albigriseus]
MIGGIGQSSGPERHKAFKVDPTSSAPDSRQRDDSQTAPQSRALVPVQSLQPRERTFVRLQTGAPYLAQLIASNLGAGASGERRQQRRPDLVAGRAVAAYRSADRLGSEIEAGFLLQRSA